jgi:hypothetical protein
MKDIYMGFNACPGFTPEVCLGPLPKLLTLFQENAHAAICGIRND